MTALKKANHVHGWPNDNCVWAAQTCCFDPILPAVHFVQDVHKHVYTITEGHHGRKLNSQAGWLLSDCSVLKQQKNDVQLFSYYFRDPPFKILVSVVNYENINQGRSRSYHRSPGIGHFFRLVARIDLLICNIVGCCEWIGCQISHRSIRQIVHIL